jgi:4a-hydroxytetrahydrobiopterin dehydratase
MSPITQYTHKNMLSPGPRHRPGLYNAGFLPKEAPMESLAQRNCQSGKVARLNDPQVEQYLSGLTGWQRTGNEIARTFKFENYHQTMAFVNGTAWISHRQDHHPDLEVGYNKCKVRYSTHSVGGLSENDFICAAKIEALFKL